MYANATSNPASTVSDHYELILFRVTILLQRNMMTVSLHLSVEIIFFFDHLALSVRYVDRLRGFSSLTHYVLQLFPHGYGTKCRAHANH